MQRIALLTLCAIPPAAFAGAGLLRFLWSLSLDGDDDLFINENGGAYIELPSGTRNVAYALYGAVPTPGTAAVLGMAGLTATRRRRFFTPQEIA